jgi:hypothetical protein
MEENRKDQREFDRGRAGIVAGQFSPRAAHASEEFFQWPHRLCNLVLAGMLRAKALPRSYPSCVNLLKMRANRRVDRKECGLP